MLIKRIVAGYTARDNPLFLTEIQNIDVLVQFCFLGCFTQVIVVKATLPPMSMLLYVLFLGTAAFFGTLKTLLKMQSNNKYLNEFDTKKRQQHSVLSNEQPATVLCVCFFCICLPVRAVFHGIGVMEDECVKERKAAPFSVGFIQLNN